MPPVLALALIVASFLLGSRLAVRATDEEGVTELDPRRVSLAAPAWAPASWEGWMAARIAEAPPISTLDRASLTALVERLAAMPQVAEVVDWRVVWPDGLSLEIELRRPVACVRSGEDFLPVSADGVLLPGPSSEPPDLGAGPLPVLGPLDGSFDAWMPGDVLEEPRHLDALSVALSLERHLDARQRARLGPLVVDATHAAATSVDEPGVRLLLADRRLALFGRAPRADAPGELPAGVKWGHLIAAIARLDDEPGFDWDLVDLRWDRAPLRPRGPG